MRGAILGATGSALCGVILPRGAAAVPALVWSIAGTTQITEEAANAVYTVSYANPLAPGQTATIRVASAAGTATRQRRLHGRRDDADLHRRRCDGEDAGDDDHRRHDRRRHRGFPGDAREPATMGTIAGSSVNTLVVNEDASLLAWSIAGPTSIAEGDTGNYTVELHRRDARTGTAGDNNGRDGVGCAHLAGRDGEQRLHGGVERADIHEWRARRRRPSRSRRSTIPMSRNRRFRVTVGGASIGNLAASQVNTLIVSDDAAGFAVDAVTFDGTNDYLSRGAALTGASDSRKVWGSFWYRKSSAIATNESFFGMANGNKAWLYHSTFGSPAARMRLLLIHSSGSPSLEIVATIGMDNDGDWHHVAWYADTNQTAGAKVGYIYHDGVDVTASKVDAGVAFDINLSSNNINIGSSMDGGSGIAKFSGDLAEFILAPGQDFDISNPVNLAKLRSGAGKPVDVGADGSTSAALRLWSTCISTTAKRRLTISPSTPVPAEA